MIPDSSIKKVQSQCTRKVKSWLGLTRRITNAVTHHPNVIDIPAISEYRTKTKLTFLSSILTSEDPMITEISELLLDQGFTISQRIPSKVNQVLALAKNSISTITTKTLSRKCASVHRESRVKHWNDKLSELTVQSRTRIPEQCLEAYPERNACWTAVISTKGKIRHSPCSSKLATLETKARCQVPSL